MSDTEDYMSDAFIQSLEKQSAPSLIYKHTDRRRIQAEKRKAEEDERNKVKNKSSKVLEQEMREKQLSSEITSTNKGFEMLLKMGYKPGQGIGKNESGRVEPIPISIKTNRQGLGTANKPKQSSKNINPTKKLDNLKTDDFRGRLSSQKAVELMEADLRKSQKACEQLDQNNDVEEPLKLWFWPLKVIENNDSSESEDDEDENLNNKNDDDDHKKKKEAEEEEEKKEEEEGIETKDKLLCVTEYLRNRYFYCIWCGITYDNDDDLTNNCPGSTRDEH